MSTKTRTAKKKKTPGVALVLGCPGPGKKKGTQCGLPVSSKKHCQQHYKQLLAGEELQPLADTPWHGARTDSRVVGVVGAVQLPEGGTGIVIAVKGCKGPSNDEDEETCGKPVYAKELCRSHYTADLAGRPLKPLRRRRQTAGGVERWGCNWHSEAHADAVHAFVTEKGLEQGKQLGVREFIVTEMERRVGEKGLLPKKPPQGPRVERWGCTWSSAVHADAVTTMVRAEEGERGEPLSERTYFVEELEKLAQEAGYYSPGSTPAHAAG